MFVVSVWGFVGGGGIVVHAVVVGEVVRAHVQRAKPRVIAKREGQRRGPVGLLALLVDEVSHAGQMRGIGL